MSVIRCTCGALLVDEVTLTGVRPTGGEPLVFRRTTDHVVCSACLRSYDVRSLIQIATGEDAALLSRLVIDLD